MDEALPDILAFTAALDILRERFLSARAFSVLPALNGRGYRSEPRRWKSRCAGQSTAEHVRAKPQRARL